MTATAAAFTAARVQGRYRVLDAEGQIVVTLNSKAKAEARAAELNAAQITVAEADSVEEIDAALAVLDSATADLAAQVEADVAMEQEMDAECPQEDGFDWDEPQVVLAGQAAPLAEQDAPMESVAEIIARQDAEEAQVLADEEAMQRHMAAEEEARVARAAEAADLIAELDAQAAARAAEETPASAAEERQEEPAQDAGTEDTPEEEKAEEKPAKTVKGKTAGHNHKGQPEPHAFTTVGTKVKNHCASCGRTWAAAAHRKFREAQADAPVVEVADTEEEWTPAPDDTTPNGEAPALADA
jgi:hypothetical protein